MNQYTNRGMQGKNCPYISCNHNLNNTCQQYGAVILGRNQCTHYQKKYQNTYTYANTKKTNKTNKKDKSTEIDLAKIAQLDKRILWPIITAITITIANAYMQTDKLLFTNSSKLITIITVILAIWLGHKAETQNKNQQTEENKNEQQ